MYSDDDLEVLNGEGESSIEDTDPMDNEDNAGDANANGDGSATLEDRFMAYDSDDESGDKWEAQSNNIAKDTIPSEKLDKLIVSKLFTLGWPSLISMYREV